MHFEKEMKTIPLTQGKVALVDDVDYEWAMQWKWQAYERKLKYLPTQWYATCKHYVRGEKNGGPTYYMHREIVKRMGILPTADVDHVDCDGLNNTRSNLRHCSDSQNQANRRKCNGSSVYKGVRWFARTKKWVAKIGLNKGCKHLGYFNSEKDAAIAYNTEAVKIFGPFARINEL